MGGRGELSASPVTADLAPVGCSDLTKYDVDTLVKVASGGQADMSYTLAMEMTSELLLLEMVNRVSVCWFEVGAGRAPCADVRDLQLPLHTLTPSSCGPLIC